MIIERDNDEGLVGNMFVVKMYNFLYLTSSLSISNEWSIRRNIKICLLNCIVIILHCRYCNMTGSYLTSSSTIICTYCITANAFQSLRFQDDFLYKDEVYCEKRREGMERDIISFIRETGRHHRMYNKGLHEEHRDLEVPSTRFNVIWYVFIIFDRTSNLIDFVFTYMRDVFYQQQQFEDDIVAPKLLEELMVNLKA